MKKWDTEIRGPDPKHAELEDLMAKYNLTKAELLSPVLHNPLLSLVKEGKNEKTKDEEAAD